MTKTDDFAQFRQWLDVLTAYGGGDTPKLAVHAIRLAMHGVRPGSNYFVFIDAPAKDEHLKPEVLALAMDKQVRVRSSLRGDESILLCGSTVVVVYSARFHSVNLEFHDEFLCSIS